MISFNNVYKSFGKRVILEDASCIFPKGETSLILAPSGTGKSTLLNLISGLDTPGSGDISIGDQSLSSLTEDELSKFRLNNIGIIFQFFNFLTSLSIIKNIILPQTLKGDSKSSEDQKKTALKLCNQFGIDDIINSWPEEVSGGELQRAAIVRALINNPDIILADEPTGNLDKDNAEVILSYLCKISKDMGKTVLIVSHDLSFKNHVDNCFTIENKQIVLKK